jgi:hypothetical protein
LSVERVSFPAVFSANVSFAHEASTDADGEAAVPPQAARSIDIAMTTTAIRVVWPVAMRERVVLISIPPVQPLLATV